MNPRTVVILVLSFIIAAVLLPIALNQIGTTSHTLWNAAVWTIFSVVFPILVVIALAIKYIPSGKGGQAVKHFLKDFKNDTRAVGAMDIVTIVIGVFLLAILFPIGMSQLAVASVNATTLGTPVFTILTIVLPILFLIGAAIRYIPSGKKGG